MAEEVLVVLSTFPDAETARRIGRTLVEEGLAACANILPGMESIYRWKGEIETTAETLALLKTTTWRYQALEARLRELHPYEVPEIVGLRAAAGHLDYMRWVEQSVTG